MATQDKMWVQDVGHELPEQVRRLPALVRITPPPGSKRKFDSIVPPVTNEPEIDCAITVYPAANEKGAFCFHKTSGVVIQKIEPLAVGRRVAAYRCDYGAFQMFGSYTYPREMECFVEGHKKIEVKVLELTAKATMDPGLFSPPVDAVEIATCSGKLKHPKPIAMPLDGGAQNDTTVAVKLVVDVRGNPRNVRVVHSGGKESDEAALHAVRTWRFSPATCDGRKIPTEMSVEVSFVAPR